MGHIERVEADEVSRYYTSQTRELERIVAYERGYREGARNQRRKYEERRKRSIYFAKQKALGALMLALSIIIPAAVDGDATVCILTIPIGLALLLSKEMMIYNSYFIEVQERKGN